MNDKYYEEIKDLLVNNEMIKSVKEYSKNKSDTIKLGSYLVKQISIMVKV